VIILGTVILVMVILGYVQSGKYSADALALQFHCRITVKTCLVTVHLYSAVLQQLNCRTKLPFVIGCKLGSISAKERYSDNVIRTKRFT
jgi:uncharacterized membrane protein